MSSLTSPLVVKFLSSGNQAELVEEFSYYTDGGITYIVPVGFVTDFATSPTWAQAIVPKIGPYTKACILHDYWYKVATNTKAWADKEFLKTCLILGTPRWKAYIMYAGVRLFGRGNY